MAQKAPTMFVTANQPVRQDERLTVRAWRG